MTNRPFLRPFLIVVFVALVLFTSYDTQVTELATLAASSAGDDPIIRINEVMFYPEAGDYEWVELVNDGASPVDISGYGLTDEDGNWYEITGNLPAVPPGAFVLILFDGLGSGHDDIDFSDNVATLHSQVGLTDILEDDADQVALYLLAPQNINASHMLYLPFVARGGTGPYVTSIVAFTAWGAEPSVDGTMAVLAGIWVEGMYRELLLPGEPPTSAVEPGESMGLMPGGVTGYASELAIYQASQVTPGEGNPIPAVHPHTYAGDTLDGDTFALSWYPVERAIGYWFQMDNNSNFTSPEVDLIIPDPAYVPATAVVADTYFWRVRPIVDGSYGNWSTMTEIQVTVPTSNTAAHSTLTEVVLGIEWQLQRKDTKMLCLAGDHETGGDPADLNAPWDAPHPNGEGQRRRHGINYCSRAAISMLASYYGAGLSQDRIAYEDYQGMGNDLGHGVVNNTGMTQLLVWARIDADRYVGTPSWQQVVSWIDAGRPLIILGNNHFRVIDGYREMGSQEVHVLDSWTREQWLPYANQTVGLYWVGPSSDSNVRSDEDEDNDGIRDTFDDSDGDGIVDFDERYRFVGLDWTDPDSDGDDISEKNDMRVYLFENDGDYRNPQLNPDYDGDGQRKENDADNDNGGSRDGCEDVNLNGKYEPHLDETSNFDTAQERRCGSTLIAYIGPDENLWLMAPDGSHPTQVTFGGGYRLPKWSQDGTQIGVVKHVSGLPMIFEEIWAYSVGDLTGQVVATYSGYFDPYHVVVPGIVNFEWVTLNSKILYAVADSRAPARSYYLTDIQSQNTQLVGYSGINYFRPYREEKWAATQIEPVTAYFDFYLATASYEHGINGFELWTLVPTSCPGDHQHPSWSPDGSRIAYTCDASTLRIFDVNSGAEEVIFSTTPPPNRETPALLHTDWSPDGSRILFSFQSRFVPNAPLYNGNGLIYAINPDGSGMSFLANGVSPVWRP